MDIHRDLCEEKVGWYGPEDCGEVSVNAEVRGWRERALAVLHERRTFRDHVCLRVRAVAAVAAVRADELAMQAEHLRPAQLALLAGNLQSLRSLRLFAVLDLCHAPSIRAL